MINMIVETQEG